ncbi:hypothetical protein ASJ33_05485 [Dehalococcoides mccartyi]|nr:hypothetical protein ASJ33_05485 [Dehalococcoides mccartyi]
MENRKFTEVVTECSECPKHHELTEGIVKIHWCAKYRREINLPPLFWGARMGWFPKFCKLEKS